MRDRRSADWHIRIPFETMAVLREYADGCQLSIQKTLEKILEEYFREHHITVESAQHMVQPPHPASRKGY